MPRPFDHLSDDEIDALVVGRAASVAGSGQLSEQDSSDAQRHIESCEDCYRKVQMHKFVQNGISRAVSSENMARRSGCSEEAIWFNVAAGLLPEAENTELMKHAAQCGHCGPLLRNAVEVLSDDTTPHEEQLLRVLSSSGQKWRKRTAHMLRETGSKPSYGTTRTSWWGILSQSRFAWTGVLAIFFVGLALWFGFRSTTSTDVNKLLTQAYSENRVLEMRIQGAAPPRQNRGPAAGYMSRPSLAKAQAMIVENLQLHPDNSFWLQASGRASLLEGNADAAITSLEKAQQFAANDSSVAIDLATGYFLRANVLKRSEDDARAVDILGKVVATNPRDEVARFNYAIALEKLSLNQQALEQWSMFLQLYPSSEWANEAKSRRSALEEKIREHEKRSAVQLHSSQEIAQSLTVRRSETLEQLDINAESYLDVAITDWIPLLFGGGPHTPDTIPKEQIVLDSLAGVLSSHHGDEWLQDVLHSSRKSHSLRRAFLLMADSARLAKHSDEDQAARKALQAARLFKTSRATAGELYSTFELAYAKQLSHQNRECATVARELLASTANTSYSWLHVQAGIESAICSSTSDDAALAFLKQSIDLATFYNYERLRSRANQVLAAIYWTMGDSRNAWSAGIRGLEQYWNSSLPPLLEYNLLTNLDYLAEDEQEWFLQARVLKEALHLSAGNPDSAIQAFEQNRLGKTLLMTHDPVAAEQSFRSALALFELVPSGHRKENLIAESQIGLAKVDLQLGLTNKAVIGLAAIQPTIKAIADDDLNLDFLQTYGLALSDSDRREEAEQTLRASMQLAEQGLHLVHNERDRLKWSRRNQLAYKAAVGLKLKPDPVGAFALWERYKGASIGTGSGMSGPDNPADLLRALGNDTALVTFFVSDKDMSIWVSDVKGIAQRTISVRPHELELLARRFAEHCSQSDSDLKTLRQESVSLYQSIISPVQALIRGHHILIFEPDEALKMVPFAALLDTQGHYLADQYAIAISPGVKYLAATAPWHGLSHQSRVLIVGNPAVENSNFLPDAEEEARGIAGEFDHPILLLGTDAISDKIIRDLPRSQVFHFAGHAFANSANAALLLSHGDSLDVSKLDSLTLHDSQLVVLSACSTAEGSSGAFDDEDSLTRRLVGLGVPEVVASNWPVDSNATRILMDDFYQELFVGRRVADALNLAARHARSRPGFEHPFYWAGFSVFGRG